MRKENEIYCSNCASLITLEARFCPSCGFNQVNFPFTSNTTLKSTNEGSILNKVEPVPENNIDLKNNIVVVEDMSTKLSKSLLFIISGFAVWYIMSTISRSTSNTSKMTDTSNYSSSCGLGDALCESRVKNHINGISGVEVNFISYIQNNDGSPSGKFRVGFLKQDERGINQFSATITTDCNCNVIDAGGIVSH